jgi:small-conductance mechanosensitive channel
MASRSSWRWDDIVISSLYHAPFLIFVVAGVYAATLTVSLEPKYRTLIDKGSAVILIAAATIVLARVAAGLVSVYHREREGGLPSVSIISNIARLAVLLIGLFVILQQLGVSITPLITALGIGGVAVALALQETLSNLISGFAVVASRQIRPGDYVRIEGGEEGYVTDVRWRSTTIRSFPENNMIVVPNSKLASSIVTNYNLPEKLMWLIVPVGVSYKSDLEHVERVTLDVAKELLREIEGGMADLEPRVRYQAFGDFSIDFNVRIPIGEFAQQYVIRHEFIKRLHRRYRDEGIEIPFPIRTVYMRQ